MRPANQSSSCAGDLVVALGFGVDDRLGEVVLGQPDGTEPVLARHDDDGAVRGLLLPVPGGHGPRLDSRDVDARVVEARAAGEVGQRVGDERVGGQPARQGAGARGPSASRRRPAGGRRRRVSVVASSARSLKTRIAAPSARPRAAASSECMRSTGSGALELAEHRVDRARARGADQRQRVVAVERAGSAARRSRRARRVAPGRRRVACRGTAPVPPSGRDRVTPDVVEGVDEHAWIRREQRGVETEARRERGRRTRCSSGSHRRVRSPRASRAA